MNLELQCTNFVFCKATWFR